MLYPFVEFQLARVKLTQLDAVGAARHAQRALAVYPRHDWALRILRNTDMQLGRYDAAIARYEKAYPELFAFDLLHLDGKDLTGQPLLRRRALLPRVVDGSELLASEELLTALGLWESMGYLIQYSALHTTVWTTVSI